MNTEDQLNSEAESTSHGKEKEEEMACLPVRGDTDLWFFAYPGHLLGNQCSSNSAYPFPNDESTKYKKMNKNKTYRRKYGICLCTGE